MYSKDTQIVETTTGQWLRFPNHFKKSTCLVELSNQISLNIDSKTGSVYVHKMDQNHVYQPVGELFISASNNQIHCTAVQGWMQERVGHVLVGPVHPREDEDSNDLEKGETA